MAGGRLRAFRTYGTSANLRAILLEFASAGGGFCTSLVPAAQSRIGAMAGDIDGLQATTFDKIVARCLTLGGEAMLPVSDSIQEREALAKACERISPDSPFFACRQFAGFVRRLHNTLAELRHWRIGASELRQLAQGTDSWLGAKLGSLAELDDGLRSGLRAAARELETERMERCLSLGGLSAKTPLFLYSGGEYAPLWADWLAWASRAGVEVWLVVDSHANNSRHCEGAQRMLEHLRTEASFKGNANGLAEGLFANQPPLDPGLKVRIVSTGDALAECEWALRALAEEVEGGTDWNRTAIYLRNPDDHLPLLEATAERLGAPLRTPRRELLERNGWVKFLCAYLKNCAADSPIGFADLAPSSYLSFSKEVVQHYREAIQLSHHEDSPWQGLERRLDRSNASDLWLFDAIRLHGKGELGPIPVREWVDELHEMIDGDWLQRSIEDFPTQVRDKAAGSALMHALVQKATLAEAGGEESELSEFLMEFQRLLDQVEYVWQTQDQGITVVSSAYGLGQADALCVLGLIEGAFPRRRSEDPVLSDMERAEMDRKRKGKPPLFNSHVHARAERDELVRLCAAAGKDLMLFYPLVDDERDNTPAFYLQEIRRVAGNALTEHNIPSARLAPPNDECLFESDKELCGAIDGLKSYAPDPSLTNVEIAATLRGLPEDGVSPSELRDAMRCSFQYVFKRRLGLRPGHPTTKWHRLRYLPDATRMPLISSREEAKTTLANALEAELESLGNDVSPSERKLMTAGGRREISGWVDREFLSRDLWQKNESNRQFGVEFGEAQTAKELPILGKTILLRGRFASVADLGGIAIGQIYGGRDYGGTRNLEKIEDPDFLELGVYLWTLCKRQKTVALEVDTHKGERVLMVLPKPEDLDIESRVGQGLRVVDLGEKQKFFERTKELLSEAVRRIESGEMTPKPGDYCRFCDHGELCRRAQGWSEGFDPFQEETSFVD